jgi:hypothetical protein
MKRLLLTAVILAAVASTVAAPAFAAKGEGGKSNVKGKGPASSTGYSIVLATTGPRLGDLVDFDYSADRIKDPRIQVMCYQSDELVYAESGPAGNSFLLGGGWSLWIERNGDADCAADLYFWDWNRRGQLVFMGLASTSFTAAG